MRKILACFAALVVGFTLIPSHGSADIADYQTVGASLGTTQSGSDYYVTRTAICPEGYAAVAGGYRFTADDASSDFALAVSRDEPYASFPPALGSGWLVSARADRAGTLRVWAICTV